MPSDKTDTNEREWFTTRQAAEYLGYQDPSAIRREKMLGRLEPDGRRGNRAYTYRKATLDAWMRNNLAISNDNRSNRTRRVAHLDPDNDNA